jgi:hypothetical protein
MNAIPKSPFPGMDPYLESRWGDVHQRLCTYACDQLQEQLGGNLIARLGERLVVESLLDKPRAIYPDVRVVEEGWSSSSGGTAVMEDVAAVTEAIVIEFADEHTEAFIEIIEPDSATLVTVVEFLSPSNKWPGDGREQYQRKQRELYNAGVNLVEIDLIRAGPRVLMLPEVQFPPGVKPTYAACVFRATHKRRTELYPISLRQRLPNVSVPLRKEDRDIVLRLQPLIDLAYRNGRHDRTDYRQPCIPPLDGEDGAWAEGVLKNVRQ